MAHKSKHDKFRFTFPVFIRLVIFGFIIYLAVIYLSSKNGSSVVLGDSIEIKPVFDNIYQQIPPQSRQKIETLSSNPVVLGLQQKVKTLQQETNGFPQKQINDIKVAVVNQIYQTVMKNIQK